MTTKKYSFRDHPDHEAQLRAHNDPWIENALNCAPMTEHDRETMRAAIHGLYAAANLPAPRNIVFASGPVTAGVAAAIAAGVWWLRDNASKHRDIALSGVTEEVLMRAIPVACEHVFGRRKLPKHEATDAATYAATYEATNAATSAATSAATIAATYEATYEATIEATSAATYAATYEATDAATIEATSAATYEATSAATIEATSAATSAATYAATIEATDEATNAATSAATIEATDEATNAATYAATYEATDEATNAATYAATRANGDLIVRTARYLVLCTQYWHRLRHGGNQWSGWVSRISFFRHVAKLPINYSKWQHAEAAAIHGGPRFMHAKFCIVADRPEWIHRDGANRPHRIDGPFCRWRDGIALYRVRGVQVPAEWIEHRDTIDPTLALTHRNIEQRRALCEILGWSKVLAHLKPRTISKDADPQIGELIEVELPDAGTCRFLRVKCGTGREFVLCVPRDVRTARAANAWTYDLKPTQYKPEVRT